jgi:iron complex outermembrane recepter protein
MKAATQDAGTHPRVSVLPVAIAEVLRSVSTAGRKVQAKGFRPAVFAAGGGAILASALAVVPAPAHAQQQQQQDAAIEEIRVTGSRIVRQDFTANSPITTVDAMQFEETATIGVETVLNQLPQFVPAVTQFTTGDVQNTATNTVGASVVSLRGLGANRNLVLVNGRRAQPINGTMVVDTNSIPSSAIARVEVISGGASAVYGADAVGGVVNFILRDNFEGATLDVQLGDTQHGGNQSFNLASLIGANVADGRGNVMLGLEYASRTKLLQQDRDWRVDERRHPNVGGNAFFGTETWFGNMNGVPLFGPASNNPSPAVVQQLFPGTTINNFGTAWFINRTPDGTGTVFTGLQGNNNTAQGAYRYEGSYGGFDANGIEYDPDHPGMPLRKLQPDGRIAENTWFQWASTPLDRFSSFGRGVFNVSDTTRIFGQAMFTKTSTQTSLGLTSDAVGVHGAVVPFGNEIYEPSVIRDTEGNIVGTNPAYLPGGTFGLNCEAAPTAERPYNDGLPGCTESEAWPVPAEIWMLFNSRPNPNQDILLSRPLDFLRSDLGRARGSDNETNTFQLTIGVEGELPSGNHFWDASISTGMTDNVIRQRGGGKLETWRAIIGSPNFGLNWRQQGNPAGGGFQAGVASCVTGLPVVRTFKPSDDCLTALHSTLHNSTTVEQNVFEANLVGTLAEMPAGPLQYALGTTYRDASIIYEVDPLVSNEAINEMIMGLFPQQGYSGEFDVSEVYGELLIPLVTDGPAFVNHFQVELGGRYSDFSTVGGVETYKGLIDWGFFPRYRLRGGFNRAHRAPNLAELFSERSQTFAGTGAILGDPCSLRNGSPWSANQGGDPTNPISNVGGLQAAQQVEQLCRQLMGPLGAQTFYDSREVMDHPTGGGVGLPNATGNPNLTEEQADTFTLGVVMDFLDGFTLTVDYYTIEIENMIALENGDIVHERCFSPAFNPNYDPNAQGCQAILRNPNTGGTSSVDLFFTNQGRAQTSGVDVALNWSRMFNFGGLNINTVANYNIEAKTQATPTSDEIDWAGTQGCALGMQCQGYDYRIFTTFSYFNGPFSVSLRHQYWPEIQSGACINAPLGTACQFGGVQTSYQLFTLTGNYRFNDRYTLRVGIENLFDKIPPLSGGNPLAEPFPTYPTRTGAGATYDPLGRRGFITFAMDF